MDKNTSKSAPAMPGREMGCDSFSLSSKNDESFSKK